jgi:hypothetical protein
MFKININNQSSSIIYCDGETYKQISQMQKSVTLTKLNGQYDLPNRG